MDDDAPLILIGGTGFLGTALAAHFAAAHLGTEAREVAVIGRGDWASGKAEAIGASLSDRGPLVVDLAHLAGPPAANLEATVRHLDFARGIAASRYLFVSSGGAIYGDQGDAPLAEDAPLKPISPYGIAKLAGEQLAASYRRRGLPVMIVRPSNIYGPGQLPFRGQGLVATAFGAALAGRPVTLFGDGSQRRDYLFIDDFCSGIEAILSRGAVGGTYNLGCGVATRADDLLAMIGRISARDGFPLALDPASARPSDVAANLLDISKIKHDTGWVPRVGLEQGLERSWAWIRAA